MQKTRGIRFLGKIGRILKREGQTAVKRGG